MYMFSFIQSKWISRIVLFFFSYCSIISSIHIFLPEKKPFYIHLIFKISLRGDILRKQFTVCLCDVRAISVTPLKKMNDKMFAPQPSRGDKQSQNNNKNSTTEKLF